MPIEEGFLTLVDNTPKIYQMKDEKTLFIQIILSSYYSFTSS